MAIQARTAQPGTFFVSTATYNRRRLFQVTASAELLLETLQHYRRDGRYLLHAFVVMPDHLHLLITPQAITLERAVGLIKGGFSHRLASSLPVWQRSFTDHRIRDADDFATRRNYIHQKPGPRPPRQHRRSLPLLLSLSTMSIRRGRRRASTVRP